MTQTVRLATIGTSLISSNLIDAAKEVDNLEYIGTLSRSRSKGETYTSRRGGKHAFASLDEIIHSSEVDAVYIGSPNALHYPQAIDCIRAGKHVLVEKPLCANHFEVQQLFAAANLHHVISTEAMRPIHDPGWAAIAREIPKLGTLRRATFRFGKFSSRYEDVRSGRQTNIFDTRMSSGALMDMGIYPIEIMCALFGAPKEIKAAPIFISNEDNHETGGVIDGAGSLICTYGSKRDFPGLVVEIAYSKISNDYLPSQIEGENGTIVIENISAPTKATLTLRGETFRGDATTTITSKNDDVIDIEVAPCANSMVYELRDFVAMINGENIDTMWGKDLNPRAVFTHLDNASLDALAVCDEVRRQGGMHFATDFRRY